MIRLADERGGVVAKLLGILLVLAIIASAAVYWYAKDQQPLSAGVAHSKTSQGARDPATIGLASGLSVYVATIVTNTGRLPVTIEGLAQPANATSDPYVPISIELGDGKTAKPTDGDFSPPSLGSDSGIGVVVTYVVNPNLDCSSYSATPSAPVPFPLLPLRLSTYGVETTQTVGFDLGSPPKVAGITRASCEQATA